MPLNPGDVKYLSGDVTTLNWIGPRPARDIEVNLGFGAGRLAQGYLIAVLVEPLEVGDFEFGGTTMRSGGRAGLPASNNADDQLRPRVHDNIMGQRGQAGYDDLQRRTLATVQIRGPQRIAKVLPVTPHDSAMAPNLQYPMGGGGLQWKILRKPNRLNPAVEGKKFVIALQVDANGMADAGRFTVSLLNSQPFQALYDARRKVSQHLETVT
jgi:hypothetical protein